MAAADRALEFFTGIRPTSYLSLPGYHALAETYLSLWQLAQSPGDQPLKGYDTQKLKSASKQACKMLSQFARIFPIGRPAAGQCRDRLSNLSKPHRLAHKQ